MSSGRVGFRARAAALSIDKADALGNNASMDFADVQALDRADPLAPLRDRFALPEGAIYLDGNSLGRNAASPWSPVRPGRQRGMGAGLIRSWNLLTGSTCRGGSATRSRR